MACPFGLPGSGPYSNPDVQSSPSQSQSWGGTDHYPAALTRRRVRSPPAHQSEPDELCSTTPAQKDPGVNPSDAQSDHDGGVVRAVDGTSSSGPLGLTPISSPQPRPHPRCRHHRACSEAVMAVSDGALSHSLINRYYDPSTAQFLSIDPLVAETGQPYQYAGDDPVNGSDPSGDDGRVPQVLLCVLAALFPVICPQQDKQPPDTGAPPPVSAKAPQRPIRRLGPNEPPSSSRFQDPVSTIVHSIKSCALALKQATRSWGPFGTVVTIGGTILLGAAAVAGEGT